MPNAHRRFSQALKPPWGVLGSFVIQRRCHHPIFILGLLVQLVATSAQADSVLLGSRNYNRSEFKLSSGAPEANQRPNVTVLDQDHFLVTWHENVVSDCYGQVFNSFGVPLGSAFLLHPGGSAGEQYGATAAFRGTNGVAAIWGEADARVDMQFFDSLRVAFGGEQLVDNSDSWPAAASSPAGEFVVALGTADDSVYAIHYNAAGARSARTEVGSFVSGQFFPSAAYAADGRYTIVWPSDPDIIGRTYSNSFEAMGPETVLNTGDTSANFYPSAGYNSRLDLIVAWSGAGVLDSEGVFARRFRDDGSPYGNEILVNETIPGNQALANLAVSPNDDMLICWVSGGDVYGRLFDRDANPLSQQFRVNSYTGAGTRSITHHGGAHGNAFLSNSNLVIGWAGEGRDGNGVYLTILQYAGDICLGIAAQPISQTVTQAAMVTFTVTPSGCPPYTYQWRRNGRVLTGATNASLVLNNVQATDGGAYTVAVGNNSGVVYSAPAYLVLDIPVTAAGDNFADRVTIAGSSGQALGSTTAATRENMEPLHAGKPGARSVWYTWTAPASGIARFATTGSGFDTLLGIYTGNSVGGLSVVASDEDRGGFLSSAVEFNVTKDVSYHIAIDGFFGDHGNYVLAWTLEATVEAIPRITQNPVNVTVTNGGTAVFSVSTPDAGIAFRWYHNGELLPGATLSQLTLMNVGIDDVGDYFVRLSNSFNRITESPAATLEIGPAANGRSVDKFENLFVDATGSGGGSLDGAGGALGGSPIISVSVGILATQVINNTNASAQVVQPAVCSIVTGSSRWIGLRPDADGTFVLDTAGSRIPTVLVAYAGDDLLDLRMLGCETTGLGESGRFVRFNASAGVVYSIMLDGVAGAKGAMQLNWRFGVPPSLSAPAQNKLATAGCPFSQALPSVIANPPAVARWVHGEQLLPGTPNADLYIPSFQPTQIGRYSLALSNFVGSVTTLVTRVTLATNFPPALQPISNPIVDVGQTLLVTNRLADPALNGQPLRFKLKNAPAGAVIDEFSGVFRWIPRCEQGSTTNGVTIQVTSTQPCFPYHGEVSFSVTVHGCVRVALGRSVVVTNTTASVDLILLSTEELTNLTLTVVHPATRFSNWEVMNNNPALIPPVLTHVQPGEFSLQLATACTNCLHGLSYPAQLRFQAQPKGVSSFEGLEVIRVEGRRADGVRVGNAFGEPGRVAVLEREPLVESYVTKPDELTPPRPFLVIFGRPGTYETWSAPGVNGGGPWRLENSYTVSTNLVTIAPVPSHNEPATFYRARSIAAP